MPLTFHYLIRCDGPNCPREDTDQFDPSRGWNAPGWRSYDGKAFCSHLCVAAYSANRSEEEVAALREAVNGTVEEGAPSSI
jgi:hypothetical protein